MQWKFRMATNKFQCQNCRILKSGSAFFTTKRLGLEKGLVCRTCRSIVFEFQNKPNLEDELTLRLELFNIENSFSFNVTPVNRELSKFLSEYRSGHWEPALLYIGRATEALTFSLAKHLQLGICRPRIKSLNKIESAHKAIMESAKTMLASMEANDSLKNKITEQTKNLAIAAHDIQSELEHILKTKTVIEHDNQDFSYALKQLETYFAKTKGGSAYIEFCNHVSKPSRSIMDARAKAAHSNRNGERRTIRKSAIKKAHGSLKEVIQALPNFLTIKSKDA